MKGDKIFFCSWCISGDKKRSFKRWIELFFLGLLIIVFGMIGATLLIVAFGGGWHNPLELLTTGWTIEKLSVLVAVCVPTVIIGFGIGTIIGRHLRTG